MRLLILVTAISVLAAVPAFAQVPGTFEITASGGVNMPTGSLGDQSKMGFAAGASVGYRAIDQLVVGAEFMYYGLGANDDALALLGTGADMSTNIMQMTAMGKYMFPVAEMHHVYAKGVAGMYRAEVSFDNVPFLGSGSVADTNLGGGVGAGFRINGAKKTSFFGEGMYHFIQGDGGNGQFFTATAGILITMP
jgi:hypothetical protein